MNILYEENLLTLSFKKKIDYTLTAYYEEVVSKSKNTSFNVLEIDLAETSFITLPGAMYLTFIVSTIVDLKKLEKGYFETVLTGYSKKVGNMLTNFGVLHILKLYGNLKLDKELNDLSNFKLNYWRKIIKQSNINFQSLYWPTNIIPLKHGNRFELEIHNFYNGFLDYFKAIIQCGMLDNLNEESLDFTERYFLKAINESTKNVWDHSESWGIASAHSSLINKTTLCMFDFGVGFINSYIKRKGPYKRSEAADQKVLRWLFQEGNTSHSADNHGHGLSIISKFTELADGLLIINTDKYLMQYDKEHGLKISTRTYFPGTQIMINF